MVLWQKSGCSGRRSERAKQQQRSMAYSIAFQHRGLTSERLQGHAFANALASG
jgi:hypothetical protein